jgi:hypothetical protein
VSGPPFGLTAREASILRRLSPPVRIQKFLDDEVTYDIGPAACRSPRRVLRERRARCLDGALLAAAALRLQGHRPLLVDLEAVFDTDHVLAVWKTSHGWGAIARSNFSGLRYREPIYRTIRELAVSYFESYFNLRREKTLRAYSAPVDLSRFDSRGWMTAEEDLWYVAEHLIEVPHRRILPRAAEEVLATVDGRMFQAGLVGTRRH